MKTAVMFAAYALIVLAMALPFTSVGAWGVVPITTAIVGAVGLLWAVATERPAGRVEEKRILKIVPREED